LPGAAAARVLAFEGVGFSYIYPVRPGPAEPDAQLSVCFFYRPVGLAHDLLC